MKKEKALEFLKILGAKVPQSQPRTDWAVSDCPLGPWRHENGKSSAEVFGVQVEPGDSFTNCFSCGWAGSQSDLVLRMTQLNRTKFHMKYKFGDAMQLIAQAEDEMELDLDSPDIEEMLFGGKKKELFEFPSWWLDSFPKALDFSLAREYLKQRDVPDQIAIDMDLRFDTMEKRICFPVRDFKGRLMGMHGRAIDKNADLRYRMYTYNKENNPILWLGEDRVDRDKPIIVVEGPFDMTSVYRVYRNVVSPLFVDPSMDKIKRMSDALEWITFYDRGKGGEAGRKKVDKTLGKTHVITHLHTPEGRKDPGECDIEDLITLLEDKVELDEILS